MADIWAPLAKVGTPRNYAPGELIYLQDVEATYFYYLVSGTVRSYISSPSGDERVLTTHRTGDLMGDASFFAECPRLSSAVAITQSRVVSIDRTQLDSAFHAHPQLALPMLQYLARTVGLVTRQVDDMSFLKANQRVARYLLSHPEEEGTIACTHQEIGFSVGVSRVTVSRVLGEFVKAGWVSTVYRGVILSNRAALQSLLPTE